MISCPFPSIPSHFEIEILYMPHLLERRSHDDAMLPCSHEVCQFFHDFRTGLKFVNYVWETGEFYSSHSVGYFLVPDDVIY